VNKATALEEMYLIYQAVRNYLADSEPWGEGGLEDLVASYRSFCQREPIGGMFLELCWKSCWSRPGDVPGIITSQNSYPHQSLLWLFWPDIDKNPRQHRRFLFV
jgi:hypothetical protein